MKTIQFNSEKLAPVVYQPEKIVIQRTYSIRDTNCTIRLILRFIQWIAWVTFWTTGAWRLNTKAANLCSRKNTRFNATVFDAKMLKGRSQENRDRREEWKIKEAEGLDPLFPHKIECNFKNKQQNRGLGNTSHVNRMFDGVNAGRRGYPR